MYILFPTSSRLELEWLQVMHACTDMSWLLGHAQINANPCVHQRSGPSIMASVAHSAMYLHSKIMNLIVFMHGCRRKSVCACAWVQNMHGHECTASHAWTQKYLFPLLRQISILFGENCAWNFRLWKWRDILLQATWHASISPWNMHASVHGTCMFWIY